jgi:GT2 family glycosyltransferase
MRIAIVVCAYTVARWEDIVSGVGEARRQLADSGHPGELVLVVDHSPELYERAQGFFVGDDMRMLENSRERGLSGARNSGITSTDADVYVFLDDDAVPEPGWLAGLIAPFDDPSVIITGGAATPRWPDGGRPSMLPAADNDRGEFDWVIGCTYAGQPRTLSHVRNVMGCSMAMRADVFATAGLFGEDLGRVGTVPYGCEETELCIRASATPGSLILFEPASMVRHRVTPQRTTWSYLWRRCYAEGISKAAVVARTTRRAGLSTETTYTTHVLPRGVARELRTLPQRGSRAAAGAAAIVTGLVVTLVGYGVGRLAIRRAHGGRGNGR